MEWKSIELIWGSGKCAAMMMMVVVVAVVVMMTRCRLHDDNLLPPAPATTTERCRKQRANLGSPELLLTQPLCSPGQR
jgi:hypothetical protein